MYFFIYESSKLTDKQRKLLDVISLKFSDLGINFDKVTVTPLRTADILTHDAILEGRHKNIIAVGSDKTAHQVINTIAKLKAANAQAKNWPIFGMVPLTKSKIADVLRLPYNDKICGALTRRKIKKFDLGKADGNYFLTSFDIDITDKKKSFWNKVVTAAKTMSKAKLSKVEMDFDNQFDIKTKLSNLSVVNALTDNGLEGKDQIEAAKINPTDGVLDFILYSGKQDKSKEIDLSFFRGQKIRFYCKDKLTMHCDEQPIKKIPERFEIVPNAIEMIVGRGIKQS